ncbi:hypothetical protein ACIRP5_11180 [Streptomyces sp. NPDC101221]|uniref:hypothetical protein n=1 Tax=Streptomyces sp. NPDC101221 TaxID=3366132 RepID=UPI00381423BF
MASYLVTYTDGSEQHIPADSVFRDVDYPQYVFHDDDHNTIALAPSTGVLSIVRMPETPSVKAVTG